MRKHRARTGAGGLAALALTVALSWAEPASATTRVRPSLRWTDTVLRLSLDGGRHWQPLPAKPSRWKRGIDSPSVVVTARHIIVALPRPQRSGRPLMEFLVRRRGGRLWQRSAAIASVASRSVWVERVRSLRIDRQGRLVAVIPWNQGRECTASYLSTFRGRIGQRQLGLIAEKTL